MRNVIASAVAALAIVSAAGAAFAGNSAELRAQQGSGIAVEQAGNGAASGSTDAQGAYRFHDARR